MRIHAQFGLCLCVCVFLISLFLVRLKCELFNACSDFSFLVNCSYWMSCNPISGLLHLVPVHRVALVWLLVLPQACLVLVCLVLGLELLLWLVVHVPKGQAR